MGRYLITGVRGQDGRLAVDRLSTLQHEIAGISHTQPTKNSAGIAIDRHYVWDWACVEQIESILDDFKPDCVLNLAAFHYSSTRSSRDAESQRKMLEINLNGLGLLVAAIIRVVPNAMLVHASSSQIYTARETGWRVDELTNRVPSTIYGFSKSAGMQLIDYYRRNQGLRACSAILFNHESVFRSSEFVSRTISREVARISLGLSNSLVLRNTSVCADFSCAGDVVEGLIKMAEQDVSEDYVVGSGQATSVGELAKYAFETVDLDATEYVQTQETTTKPYPIADIRKISTRLNWYPRSSIKNVMQQMVRHDVNNIKAIDGSAKDQFSGIVR